MGGGGGCNVSTARDGIIRGPHIMWRVFAQGHDKHAGTPGAQTPTFLRSCKGKMELAAADLIWLLAIHMKSRVMQLEQQVFKIAAKRIRDLALAVSLVGLSAASAQLATPEPSDPVGEWLVQKKNARIKIVDCDPLPLNAPSFG